LAHDLVPSDAANLMKKTDLNPTSRRWVVLFGILSVYPDAALRQILVENWKQ